MTKTVGFRPTEEQERQLQEYMERSGVGSRGLAVKQLLDELLGGAPDEMTDAQKSAYNQGFQDAKREYGLSVKCSRCGKIVFPSGEDWAEFINEIKEQYDVNFQWQWARCNECREKYGRPILPLVGPILAQNSPWLDSVCRITISNGGWWVF